MSKFMRMEAVLAAEIKIWPRQKRVQYQDLAVDAHGMPVRILVAKGTIADCNQAEVLIDNIEAKVLLADRGYDSDAIVEKAQKAGMKEVIPPRKNRKAQRECDKELYKLRHFVKNAFMILKRWRGVATRYAKNTAPFLAAVQIRCMAAWVF